MEKIEELESFIKLLLSEKATLLKELLSDKATLLKELKQLKEVLELALEELALTKEELEVHVNNRKGYTAEFDSERNKHKEEVRHLKNQLGEALSNL